MSLINILSQALLSATHTSSFEQDLYLRFQLHPLHKSKGDIVPFWTPEAVRKQFVHTLVTMTLVTVTSTENSKHLVNLRFQYFA